MKVIYSCVLLLAVAIVASQAYSASWGRRNNGDYLLSRQTEVRNPVKNSYLTITVDYPRAGAVGYYNITFVNVIDNFRNNSGATPSLWSGGPGYRFAQVNLRSQVSRGLNSTVEIWGR
ncbi:hypothetical protein KR222_002686 [Zaprionus bogoriensis]|nr:hypothetical protein KR222_002686 [Zaprionus bogoriensis]